MKNIGKPLKNQLEKHTEETHRRNGNTYTLLAQSCVFPGGAAAPPDPPRKKAFGPTKKAPKIDKQIDKQINTKVDQKSYPKINNRYTTNQSYLPYKNIHSKLIFFEHIASS